jgi:hypothetical protein
VFTCSLTPYLVGGDNGNEQIFLQSGDAAAFNLSLLTSDVFAVVAAKFLFGEQLSRLYFLGFSLIVAGLVVYHRAPAPTTDLDDTLEAKEQTHLPLLGSSVQ